MKVLLVVYRDNERSGGSIRVAEVLARSLPRLGVDLNVAVAYGEGGRLKRLLGDKCFLMNAKNSSDLKAWFRYRRFIKNLAPDIVHYVDNAAWMVLASLGAHSKRIMHQHFRPDVGPLGHKRFRSIRWLLGTADKIIAISHGAGRQLVTKCHIRSDKVAVVHNAVDASYLLVDECVDNSEKCILGMAVRIVEDKGIEDALNLLCLLPERFELAIAGDGPARERLVSLAVGLGISHRVNWMGSVAEIADFYRGINFYLFMSWYEGFGLSVAEAMLCGKPVVGLLGDGEIAEPEFPLVTNSNSILVRRSLPGEFTAELDNSVLCALRDEICSLDIDFQRKSELICFARNWVSTNFSSERFSGKIYEVYSSVLSNSASKNGLAI